MPTNYPRGGGLTLASHEDTNDVAENGDASRPTPMTCDLAWHLDPAPVPRLRSVAACVIRFARARPLEGYPSSLAELNGIGCEVARGHIDVDGKPLAGLDYRPGPAAGGPRRQFEAVAAGDWQGFHGRFYLDETGVVRYEAKGEPGKQSPAIRDVEARRADSIRQQAEQVSAAGREALAPCEAGDADACDRHAEYLLLELKQRESAEIYFRRACEAGRSHSCAAIPASDKEGNPEYDGMYVRGQCRQGNARACKAVPRIRPRMTPDEVRELERSLLQGTVTE
jgi:hypothetical protein